jgi:hypothetical protein
VRLDADKIIAKERPNIAWKGGNGASQRREVYPVQTVHLNIAWLSSDSKIYLAKRVAAKRTAQVTHRTIRSSVSKPDEHCGNLECPRKPTTFIRDLARVSQARHGALLR